MSGPRADADLDRTAADCDHVAVRRDDGAEGVTTVAVSRPEKRNALNAQVRRELKAVLDAVDASDTRVCVLTGDEAGQAFVAGADVGEFAERDHVEQRDAMRPPRVYETVADLRQPVVARINGHALGGGLELALACDVRLARADAKLGSPEVGLGLLPGGGATQRLPRLVGSGTAMELVLTGDLVEGSEAAELGLVDDAVPADDLDDRVYGLAESIAGQSAKAVEYATEAVRAASRMPLDEGMDYERELFLGLFATGEKDEGVAAFFEDREPEWEY
ncbi:MAG: enoyl-CoA hydratase/isomerase family protein [Haloferacaceae archaeon]